MEMIAQMRIQVPADVAWEWVGTRFGDVAEWAAPIVSSSLDVATAGMGAVRTCEVEGFGPLGTLVVQERLVRFEDADRSLTYEATSGMPSFLRGATNRWTVRSDGPDACVVRTHATLRVVWWMRPLAPVMAIRLRREAAAVLQELAYRLETGRPHPRKVGAAAAGGAGPTVR